MRTRVKICGISSPEQALMAESFGADALGLVFVPQSPRFVEFTAAAKISAAIGPFVKSVGLFVNPSADKVIECLAKVDLDILQFHGNEEVDFCESFGLPYIKAVRVQTTEDILDADYRYSGASALLLDSYSNKAMGGTGESFDWSLTPKISRPLILAGGLNPDNVRSSISQLDPYAVDVSSGVESAPGVKDPDRMRAFISQVNAA